MKFIIQYIITLSVLVFSYSCKKDEVKPFPVASFNVVHAIVNGSTAKFGANVGTISVNGNTPFGLRAGSNNLYIYPSTDSLHPYYTNTINTNDRDIYTVFLGGTTSAVDAVLVKETIPYRTDSTAGIRFINLASNKPSLNVTLSTTPTVNDVNGLAYKTYTDFKTYPGLYNSTYTFQIRDDATASPATPLATFALTSAQVPRFANITLVIRQNGTGVAVFRVNNDR